MAKTTEFLETLARATGTPKKTLVEMHRREREAGITPPIGRGQPGPDVTARIASKFLLGLIGGDEVMKAPITVEICERLTIDHYEGFLAVPSFEEYLGLPPGHTLGQAVEAVIAGAVNDTLHYQKPVAVIDALPHRKSNKPITQLEIAVERPNPRAKIAVYSGSEHLWTAIYLDPKITQISPDLSAEELQEYVSALGEEYGHGGMTKIRAVGMSVIRAIGDCLRGDKTK